MGLELGGLHLGVGRNGGYETAPAPRTGFHTGLIPLAPGAVSYPYPAWGRFRTPRFGPRPNVLESLETSVYKKLDPDMELALKKKAENWCRFLKMF